MRVLLINPFPSARYMSDKLKQNNVHATAVYTVDFTLVVAYLCPAKDIFNEQVFLPNATSTDIIAALGNVSFDYVINGFEAYLDMTEQLIQHYTPQYEVAPQTSYLRDNKISMHKALQKHGLNHIYQEQVTKSTYRNVINNFKFPVFVKPLNGAGSLGAKQINNHTELEHYFAVNEYNVDYIGQEINSYIMSEVINGEEYFIDSFSVNGKHIINQIQKNNKSKINGACYSYQHEYDEQILTLIHDYISNALDAIEFNNGFAHSEIFLTTNLQPILIEVNPRISGASGTILAMQNIAGNQNQIDVFLNQIFNIQQKPEQKYLVKCLCLYNGGANKMPDLTDTLIGKYGVSHIVQIIPPGALSRGITSDLSSISAYVIIKETCLERLEQNATTIRNLDNSGWVV